MTLEELYQYYGGANKAAKAVGVSRQSFYMWMNRGFIPFYQQKLFEKLTKGKLKAEEFPEKESFKENVIRLPHFRYYSDEDGMCAVKSLLFREGRLPQVTYFHPSNKDLLKSSFMVDRLMQATQYIDANAKRLYEGDIILFNDTVDTTIEMAFVNINLLGILSSIDKFSIIGNTFEGKNNG